MKIIPAIDIINGKCVRLTKGDYATKKVYNENPLEVAKAFEDHGVKYLHLVDLDGAKSKHIINHKVLYDIASNTSLKIDFGGGIKRDEDIRIAFESGANQVVAGSVAISDPGLFLKWLSAYGPDKLILGADCKNRKIATHGWLESSETDVVDFIKNYEEKGVQYVVCTDIAKDGMLKGPSFELYNDVKACSNVKLIASGGITTSADIIKLRQLGCEGAIIGKAIYEGTIKLKNLKTLC